MMRTLVAPYLKGFLGMVVALALAWIVRDYLIVRSVAWALIAQQQQQARQAKTP